MIHMPKKIDFFRHLLAQFFFKDVLVEKIIDANTGARHFISVTRAYASFGCSEMLQLRKSFSQCIKRAMIQHDHVSFPAQEKVVDRISSLLEKANFFKQNKRINNHAIANDIFDVRIEN